MFPPIAEKGAGVAELVVLNGVAAGTVFVLGDVPAVVGRSPEAHLRIRGFSACSGEARVAVVGSPAKGCCGLNPAIWSMFGVFWAYAGDLLGGAAVAGGFALINSSSALGGFVAPLLMGVVRERTHSFTGALLLLAALALLAALTAFLTSSVPSAAQQRAAADLTFR